MIDEATITEEQNILDDVIGMAKKMVMDELIREFGTHPMMKLLSAVEQVQCTMRLTAACTVINLKNIEDDAAAEKVCNTITKGLRAEFEAVRKHYIENPEMLALQKDFANKKASTPQT